MCTRETPKNWLLFCSFIVWNHLQTSVCGMKLGQFGHRQYYRPYVKPVVNTPQSPCPNIFEYRYDEKGVLFGLLQIPIPNSNVLALDVEFVVADRIIEVSIHQFINPRVTIYLQNFLLIIEIIIY